MKAIIISTYGVILANVIGGIFTIGLPINLDGYAQAERVSFCQADRIICK